MKYYSKKQWTQKLTVMVLLAMALGGTAVQAMPSGGDIRSGQGSISQHGKDMTVRQNSDRMAVDWTKFDIAKDETVRYAQPDRNAIALNRVTGRQQSVIAGNLNANGNLILVNPNGVVFTKNSSVDVGGLVASTARLSDETMKNFGNAKDKLGLNLHNGSTAAIVNEGQIKANGSLVALHAANVENKGTITNEGGTIALAAAKNLTLSAADDDKLNFTVDGELAKSQALNSGSLKADGGYVVMTAKSAGDVLSTVVNNTGTIEAKTLRKNEKGQILLDGGKSGQVEVSGTLDASGTDKGQDSGNIKVIGQKTIVHDNTNLLANGDINGGKIETSGDVLDLGDNLAIDAAGVNGKHGEWLLDPLEVIISDSQLTYDDYTTSTGGTLTGDTSGKGTIKNNVIYNDPAGATVNAGSTNSSTTWINVDTVKSVLKKGTDITIQAISSTGAASITLDSPINVNIDKNASKNPTFTLEATRNITINSQITADSSGKGLNVILNADTDGDAIGAVIINADISTNGGNFISATGGTVTHNSQSNTPGYNKYSGSSINFKTPVEISGAPNHSGSTVGTYFGDANSATAARNRHISTNGGAITLNGEVAIGLNGGTLNLETNDGALTVTGIVNSGNSYDYYYYDADTDTWNKTSDDAVIKKINGYVDKVLNGTEGVPMYEYKGINYSKDKDGNLTWTYDAVYYPDATNGNAPHYVFRPLSTAEADDAGQFITNNTNNNRDKEDTTNFSHTLTTSNPKWYLTKKAGWGFNSFIVTGKSSMTIDAFLTYLKNTYGNKNNFNSRYPHGTKYSAFTDAEKVNLRKDITSYLAHNWYVAQEMASTGSKGNGDQVGDSYLATITTRLENSLTTPNGAHIMWAGGRGSGVRNRNKKNDANNVVTWYPADPTHPDGFYWVTGPEGLATDNASTYNDTAIGTGTKFWDTSSTDVQKDSNNYGQSVFGEAHWSTNLVGHQPDDNGPFLTVGYGSDNQWDDANFGGETTVGFVRETNSANSSLKINTGNGAVNLQGNIGGSQKLDTVTVNTTGNVTTGGSKVTDYNMGTIHADHGVTIKGQNVTIGGRISSGASTETVNTDSSVVTDNVTITAAGDITVHGITADGKTDENGKVTNGGKIKLTSTADNGVIKLESTANSNKNDYTVGNNKHEGDKEKDDGTLIAGSTENGAVIVDAQGKTGAFINETQGSSAITIGVVKDENGKVNKEGTWQVYVASPSDYDTKLGDNLNSKTNAQWSSESTRKSTTDEFDINAAGHNIGTYTDTSSNKFIFQVTPVITISGGSQQKTYGDTLTKDQLRKLLSTSATYTDSTGRDVDVTQFRNFKEADYLNYVTSSDGNKTGTDAVAVSSDGAAKGATRTNGNEDKKASDGNKAFYVFNVDKNENGATARNGYDLETVNGDIEILKRAVTVNENGHITYGSDKGITYDAPTSGEATSTTGLTNGDTIGLVTMTPSNDYQTSKGSHNTADAGTYDLTTDGTQTKILNNGKDVSANYDVSGSGTLTVDKATLTLDTGSTTKSYGDATGVKDFLNDKQTNYTLDGFVNGDQDNSDTQNTIRSQITNVTNTSDALVDDTHTNNVLDGGKSGYSIKTTVTQSSLKNYNVVAKQGNSVTLTPVTVTINGGMTQTYGDDTKTFATPDVTGLVNGDTLGDVSYKIKSDGNYHTNQRDRTTADAGTYSGEWLTTGAVINHGDLTDKLGTEATGNYIVTGSGDIHVEKATLTVNAKDFTQTYGNAEGVQNDANTAYEVTGFANGDDAEAKKTALEDQITVKMDATDALKDNNQHTKAVNAEGYTNEVVSASGNLSNGELNNYKVTVGTTAKVHLTPAEIHLKLKDVSTTYGTAFDTSKYGYDANQLVMANGDNASVVTDAITNKDITYTNTGDATDPNNENVKTQNAGTGYKLTGTTEQTLQNYKVFIDGANSTVDKADLTLTLKDVSTTYGQGFDSTTYGYKKDAADLQGLTNGDAATAITDVLKDSDFTYGNGGAKSDPNNENVKTQNAGSYQITGSTSKTLDNYNIKVVKPGTSIVEKAKLTLKVGDTETTYGTAFAPNTYSYTLAGNTNGDSENNVRNNQIEVSYSNGGEKSDPNNSAIKTQNVGDYDLKGTFNLKGDTAKNYEIDEVNSDLTGTAKVNKATVKVKLNDVSTTYGTAFDTSKYGYDTSSIKGLTNGDGLDVVTSALDGTYGTGNITYTNTGDASAEEKQAGKVTKTVNGGPYYLEGSTNQTLDNYNIEIENGNATINKATLHLSTGDYTEAYGDAGAVQKDLNRATTVTGEKNGDNLADLVPEIDIHNTSKALLSDTRTNDVKYKADGSLDSYSIITDFNKSLDNYDVVQDQAGSVTLKPKEITIKNTMTQQYGSSDRTYKEATVPEGQLANGDKISTKDLKFDIKSDGDYAKSLADNKKNSEAVTADAGTYNNELIHTGGGITHENGTDAYKNYKVTVEGDIVVTPAPLTITTEDVTTEYGTVKNTTSKVTGLVNGDQNYASDISYDYGDYRHGYLDNNTRTNNVGSYGITTKATNTTSDFLKNYTISYGDATLTITPKDVYFHVDGKGSTFDDIVYTVTDPNHPGNRDAINSQLLYGETVTGGYGIGQALPDTPGSKDHYYTVDSTINGTPVYDNNGQGTQVGNYVYHPTGQAVIHFDQPQKPDQTTRYVEGAHRPQDKLESALPVFRVDASGVVKQYGTYGIESQSQAVTLSPTGMRMPEPNQTSTQDRKYLTTLKTAHGHGTFRLEYNGVVLRVIPVDPAAEQIVTDGDKMKNVALSEQALHAAYTQMGLDLVNLKGVYIYMAPM